MNIKRTLLGLCTPFIAAAALAGCVTTAAPSTARLTTAQATIRASEEVGAEHVPSAALQLRLAREELAEARRQIVARDNEAARLLLLRSEADAELALALAKEARANHDLQALR